MARVRGQIWLITLGAIGAVILLNEFGRKPPELTPMDFVVGGQDALQFCDPNHPRFHPSRAAPQQPVTLAVTGAGGGGAEQVVLRTTSGKVIRGSDLDFTEGRLLRLFLVDPALRTFVEKDPVELNPGEWLFTAPPATAGASRIFADFTPKATAREMYARGALAAPAAGGSRAPGSAAPDGYACSFATSRAPLYARQPFEVTVRIARPDGEDALIQPIAGVRADLIAFDSDLSGMAKFECRAPGALAFRADIRDPGSYVFWFVAQVDDRAHERRYGATILP